MCVVDLQYCQALTSTITHYTYYCIDDVCVVDLQYCQALTSTITHYTYYGVDDVRVVDLQYCQALTNFITDYAYQRPVIVDVVCVVDLQRCQVLTNLITDYTYHCPICCRRGCGIRGVAVLHLQQRLRGRLQAAVPRGLGQPHDGLRVPQASRLSLQDHFLQRLAALHLHQRVPEAPGEWGPSGSH